MNENTNISKIRIGENDYTIYDKEAHNEISATNTAVNTLASETDSALQSLENFKTTTETFLSGIECSVTQIQGDEYRLTLNLNS